MPSSFFDSVDDMPAMTYLPHVTKLLSASSYPQDASGVAINTGKQLLFGGLVATDGSGDEEAEMDMDEVEQEVEEESRPKKKARSSKSDSSKDVEAAQGAPKRQRGRPKVSTRDETAAERRRTQIRLAQRAYRNRKENTITELTQKVESLQGTMKVLNTGFARLRETLLTSGLVHSNSVIVQQVTDLMQTLQEATDASPSDAEKTSEEEDGELHDRASKQDSDQPGSKWTDRGTVPMTLQGQTHPANFEPDVSFDSSLLGAGMGYGVFDGDGQYLTDFQSPPVPPTNSHTSSGFKNAMTTLPNEQRALMSIDRFPHKHAYTYSFQETTFARRLHRLCLERVFQRVMSPHVDPDWLLRTFRFTYNFTTKERIQRVFKTILSRGTDEPLENWRTPFVHIGGAGLHFPRTDASGRPVYPPNLLSPGRAATPWRMPITETEPQSNSVEEILESIGFDGKWFDCHDVEEYLKTKGLFPDPQASFMVVDSSLLGLPIPSERFSHGSSPSSHYSTQASYSSNSSIGSEDQISSGQQDGSTNNWLDQQQDYVPGDFDIEFPVSAMDTAVKESRLLTIEVQKFLERLSDESVCLGRAPGFRQEHVDNALVLALQEAF